MWQYWISLEGGVRGWGGTATCLLELQIAHSVPAIKDIPCVHRLPMDTATGEAVYAEASVKGKKNAVLQCALNACRMLDVQDLLRPSASGGKWMHL